MEFLPVLIGFSLTAAVHAAWVRLPFGGNAVGKFFVVGTVFGIPLLFQAVIRQTVADWSAVVSYAFVCELYVFLFTFVGSSVSARLILKLREGPLSDEAIASINDSAGMVDRRLQRLRAVGLLTPDGDGDRVSPRGRRLVRAFRVLQRFFGHAGAASPAPCPNPNLRGVRPKHRLPLLTDSRRLGI